MTKDRTVSVELLKKIRKTIGEFNKYRKLDEASMTFEEYLCYKLANAGWSFEKTKRKRNPHIGSSFDSFMKESKV